MKRSKELIGLSVISIEEGKDLGKVGDFIVNPTKGVIEYLVIDHGLKYLGYKVLPFSKVEGLGEYAVTVQSSEAVVDMANVPDVNGLLEKDVRITGTRVLTTKGQLIGSVNEFIVDEDAEGKISGCEIISVNNPEELRTVMTNQIVTFGRDVLVINDNALQLEVKDSNAAKEQTVASVETNITPENTTENTNVTVTETNLKADASITVQEPVMSEDTKENQDENKEQTKSENKTQPSEAARLFEQKQRQYLLGRKASKRIENEKGEVIIEEGQVITNEFIDLAKAQGKFSELSMNTKA